MCVPELYFFFLLHESSQECLDLSWDPLTIKNVHIKINYNSAGLAME